MQLGELDEIVEVAPDGEYISTCFCMIIICGLVPNYDNYVIVSGDQTQFCI